MIAFLEWVLGFAMPVLILCWLIVISLERKAMR